MDALLQVRLNAENSSSPEPGLELTDDHLLMTVGDIFGAGVETTTTVLKWAVLYLLHYPEVRSVCGVPPAPGPTQKALGKSNAGGDVRL